MFVMFKEECAQAALCSLGNFVTDINNYSYCTIFIITLQKKFFFTNCAYD